MKTLYLDCGMGAAGDMLTAALLELLPNQEELLERLNSLGVPGIVYERETSEKCGIRGTHITVKVNGEEESEEQHMHHHGGTNHHNEAHHHSGMHDIEHIVEKLAVPEKVKSDIRSVYSLIAEAESHVHGVPVTEIHFHEVGTMDAVADVTAVCMLMDALSPEQVIVSPVNVGSGQVKCAHGILPVPAPATAYILRDVPIYGNEIKSELCTPTGAALLKHFAAKFENMPVMRTTAIGYGMGKKDFPAANCVRAMLGETDGKENTIVELRCNLDDMTAEEIGFAEERFFEAGALEVYSIPVQMKKSRPGVLLSVMCHEEDTERMACMIFKYTTTLGVREYVSRRYTLSRSVQTLRTEFGEVRKKVSEGYGVTREKYEYEDIAGIARETGMTLDSVRACLNKNL